MKNLSLIASALAMLGLTACEKGLDEGIADVAPTGQVMNSVLQVRTRSGGSAGEEATVACTKGTVPVCTQALHCLKSTMEKSTL